MGRQRARASWRAHQMVPGLERPLGRAPSLIRAHVPGSRQSATRPPSTRVNGMRSWGLGSSGGRGRDPGTSVAICRGPGAEDPYLPGSQRQVHHPLGPHPLGLPSCWVGNSGLAESWTRSRRRKKETKLRRRRAADPARGSCRPRRLERRPRARQRVSACSRQLPSCTFLFCRLGRQLPSSPSRTGGMLLGW